MLDGITVFHRKYPGIISEVVIVDDGSNDGGATIESAMWFSEKLPLRIESLSKNSGKWAAIRKGIEVAKEDAILLLDADGSASVFEIEWMGLDNFKWAAERKVDVFGSRFMKHSHVEGKSFLRSVISKGYRLYALFWYWYATGKRDVDDTQCPWKLIHKSNMNLTISVDRWAGDIDLVCCLEGLKSNWAVQFVHVRGSKVPFSAIFSMALETMQIAKKHRKIYKVLREENMRLRI